MPVWPHARLCARSKNHIFVFLGGMDSNLVDSHDLVRTRFQLSGRRPSGAFSTGSRAISLCSRATAFLPKSAFQGALTLHIPATGHYCVHIKPLSSLGERILIV